MTIEEIMPQLEAWGSEQTKKILTRHGARDPFFGVKVGDLKKIVKKVKKNHELSLELWNTGNSDAMYLAGLIADETQISKEVLQQWAKDAYWYMLSDYSVAAVAAESPFGWELSLEWIDSSDDLIVSAGWSCLSNIMVTVPNENLDLTKVEDLLNRVEATLQDSQNRSRYAMNNFVISVGGCVPDLNERAIEVGKNIGKVEVFMGETSCQVPSAPEYILKMMDKGRLGKKKNVARC